MDFAEKEKESLILEQIRKITVHIAYEEQRGTGFILRQNDEDKVAYLFTAKHVLFGEGFQQKNTYNENYQININSDKLSLTLKHPIIRNLIVTGIVYHIKTHDDFCFFSLDLESNKILDVPSLKISEYITAFDRGYDFYTFGYPKISTIEGDNFGEYFKVINPSKSLKKINLGDQEPFEQKTISFNAKNIHGVVNQKGESSLPTSLRGLSGSGIFYFDNSILYITAIVIRAHSINSIHTIDLYNNIDLINECIRNQENINLSEIKGNTYFSFDKNLIDLENINYNKLLEHIGSVDEDDCKNYEKNRDIKLKREAIERDIVKIAQYCAYWGVKVNQENQYDKARMYFRHAIALDSRYKQFFLLVKSERRSKAENNQIIATSEEIISNPNSTSERQYEALKQKIQILQEESNNSELYNTLYDLLKISKNIEKTESTITEIGAYIDQLLQLTNLETEAALKKGESISATKYIDINELAIENNQINIAQNSIETLKNYLNREAEVLLNSGKQVNVNRYIEISDIAISNKQPETAIYLLYCAKELSKLSLSRRDSLETNKDINNKISTIVNDFDLERNIVFQTQSSAESLGSSLEKIKEQADVQLFSDVKSILAKINDIYDKSNNSGILNEIENNIKNLNSRFTSNNTDTLEEPKASSYPANSNLSTNIKSSIHGFFINIILFSAVSVFISGSSISNL
ncbi:hypothetical protein [uncultured Thiothrix sp.]|uniref:hypothetical protein n=1 Tax=uncultured Thiothrix sp. TaxID=223185 RepID=UPI00262697DB|nr:hypothetical protein [uncultured Thiothrix sp.]